MKQVAVLVGSLRRDSINLTLARSIARLAEGHLEFRILELGDLPLYNEDLWAEPPESVLRLKQDVEAADAVLFVTPEYNRSFSAVIKNAIDWGTRPWGKNSWKGKPAAVIGASPGAIGAAVGQNALKSLITVCDMALMGQPELYFSYKSDVFKDNFEINDEKTRELLSLWANKFSDWIDRFSSTDRVLMGCLDPLTKF